MQDDVQALPHSNDPGTKSASSMFDELLKWLRIGFYVDAPGLNVWRNQVGSHIASIELLLARNPTALRPAQVVRFICHKSEFHDLLGQPKEAADAVKRHVVVAGDVLIARVENIPQAQPAPPTRDAPPDAHEAYAEWVAQIVWLNLQFAWTEYFRTGQFELALVHLRRSRNFMRETGLETPNRPCHGILFRYFYYQAHCERALRRFRKSLQSFKEANLHVKLRYEFKRARIAVKGEPEIEVMRQLYVEKRFATICTARILGGGLAWNAIHQGRLTRAQELCLCAETLLLETGLEPLRYFIRSSRAVAMRRAAAASTEEAATAMKELLTLFREYRKAGDYVGQLRCGFEYVRGHIDFLACWPGKKADREKSFRSATIWLDRLVPIAKCVGDPSWQGRDLLLRARLELAAGRVGIERLAGARGIAAVPVEAVGPLTMPGAIRDRLARVADDIPSGPHDLAVEKQIVIILAACARSLLPPVLSASIDSLERWLSHHDGEPDRVVESEARLILALLYFHALDLTRAEDELGVWTRQSADIENAYLHQMASNIRELLNSGVHAFVIQPDANLGWKIRERELRSWLAKTAIQRLGQGAQGRKIAEELGIDASSWSRWRKELGLEDLANVFPASAPTDEDAS